jgi:hypothetical protein
LYEFYAKFDASLPRSIVMSSGRKYALLVGAATCLMALVYAAPIFGAEDSFLSQDVEVLIVAENGVNGVPDNEAMMAPLRQQAKAALSRLQTAAR